jgi:hypothetical protein
MHLHAESGHTPSEYKSFHLRGARLGDGWKYTGARSVCAVLVFAAGSNDLVPKAFGYLFIFPSARPPCHLTVTLLYNGADLVLLLLLDSFAHTLGDRDASVCIARAEPIFWAARTAFASYVPAASEREPKSRPQHLHAAPTDLFHTHASGPDD